MPISRVGATNGTVAADATTVTVTRSVTAGNGGILKIAVRGTVAATVGTVSDGTNTWTQAAGIAATSSTTSGDEWYCKSFASTASITVTVTWAAGASATGALTLIEVTGQDTVTFFDTGVSAAAITASCASGATGNLAQSNEFVTGSVSALGSGSFSSAAFSPNGTITTEAAAGSTGTHACQVAAFDMVGGTGGATESFTVTDSVSVASVTICTAYKAAAAVQGPVRVQQARGRQAAAAGRAGTVRAQATVPVARQSRSRGQASARPGLARAVAARPAPAVPSQARVRAVVNYARPGRVTVTRSTGAGVVIRPVSAPPPQGRDDKPHLKKLLLLLE